MDKLQSKIENILTETAMRRQDMGMGMYHMYNNDIMFTGGMRSGSSPAGYTRLKFVIYDLKKVKELRDEGMDNNDAYDNSMSGHVELMVKDGTQDFDALVNIEIRGKKSGIGRRVIKSLLDDVHSRNKPLVIFDITKNALGFWKKMGVELTLENPMKGDINQTISYAEARKVSGGVNGIIK